MNKKVEEEQEKGTGSGTENNGVTVANEAQGEVSDNPENKKGKSFWDKLKYFGVLNLGTLLLSMGVYLFNQPNKFALGGMGGLSIIIASYTQPILPIFDASTILALLNVFMMIPGFIFLGKTMTLRTIYCTLAYSLEVKLMSYLHPITVPLTDEPVLELMFSIITTGSGLAIIFNCRASSGGTDIIALIFKKYTSTNIGTALMVADFLIACLAFVPEVGGLKIGLCSVLGVFAKSFVIDGIIDNIAKTKYVTIITDNPGVVADLILENIHRGFTKFNAQGGYTGEPRTVIMTVCRRSQAVHLKAKLHEVDPTAFVIITDANEILGKGFSEKL